MAAKRTLSADEAWNRPTRLGYPEGLRGLGGVVSPLLAGFSLAAIAGILTAEDAPPQAEWAVLAFACSIALLLLAMQLAFLALARDPLPTTQLAWHPEALVDEKALSSLRRRQASAFEEMVVYWRKSNRSYDLGVVAFLAGVVLLLIPDAWTAARIAAIAVAGAALALEVWWAAANRIPGLPHPVIRGPQEIEVADLAPKAMAAIQDPDRRQAALAATRPSPARRARARPLMAAAIALLVLTRLVVVQPKRKRVGQTEA
jgi:hypothetical protein